VASLVRRFGIEQVDAIEDAVQFSLMQALEVWPISQIPENPTAWLYHVASRRLLSELRSQHRRHQLLESEYETQQEQCQNDPDMPNISLSNELQLSLLKMLFVACHPTIPVESQLAFTLKSLCGFNSKEIAIRLFISEANTYKRIQRAKTFLKRQNTSLDELDEQMINQRLPIVLNVLYLLFTEGYLSSHADNSIRVDLCEEAIHLCTALLNNQTATQPESLALMALMLLQLARIHSRQDNSGGLVLLEHQDRSLWNKDIISQGLNYLAKSSTGETVSRYHLEAGIAAQHCLSETYQSTPWESIVADYQLLERVAPSPIHTLNRAIATAEWKGAKEGLAVLKKSDIPKWLNKTYYWYAVLADLNSRCGNEELAYSYFQRAKEVAPTERIKELLIQRLTS